MPVGKVRGGWGLGDRARLRGDATTYRFVAGPPAERIHGGASIHVPSAPQHTRHPLSWIRW